MNMIKADTGKIMDGMKIIAVLYLPFLIKTLNLIFVKTIKYTNWIIYVDTRLMKLFVESSNLVEIESII